MLFPLRAHAAPGPVVATNGLAKYFMDKIFDAKHCGCGWCYLVRWVGYGFKGDRWLPGRELADCEALDNGWLIMRLTYKMG